MGLPRIAATGMKCVVKSPSVSESELVRWPINVGPLLRALFLHHHATLPGLADDTLATDARMYLCTLSNGLYDYLR